MGDGGNQEDEIVTRRELFRAVGDTAKKAALGVVVGAAVEDKTGFFHKFLRRVFSGEKDLVAESTKKTLEARNELDATKGLSGADQAQSKLEHDFAGVVDQPTEGNSQSVVDMQPKEGIVTPGSNPTPVTPDNK